MAAQATPMQIAPEGRQTVAGNTGASGDPVNTDFTLLTSLGDCGNEMSYQINAGVDYKTDSGWLLEVEIGYLVQEFDAELQNTSVADTTTATDRINVTQPSDIGIDSIFYGIRLGGSFLDERLDAYVRGGFHSYDTDSVSYSATYGFNLTAAAALLVQLQQEMAPISTTA